MSTRLDAVRDALNGLGRSGAFTLRREVPNAGLQLEVKGVGQVPFPISATKAKALCGVALLARHGYKEQTRLDTTVRDTWEIPKSRLKIDLRRWNKTLSAELEQIRKGLGLSEGCTLRAELHNLLVYAPGQFFVPHQDSEKEQGMIGTLVVTLPSTFSGGTLVVAHHEQKVEHLETGRKLSLVAFYADCRHEVRPVTSGYRIVLTYNLMLSVGTSEAPQLPARQLERLQSSVCEFLETPTPVRWGCKEEAAPPDRLVYLLDHQYTRSGLSWTHLKGADTVRVAALRAVAERLDCDVALALADVHETWSCEDMDGHRRWSSWDRRSRNRSEDTRAAPADEPELEELQDSDVSLRHFVDAKGKAAAVAGHVTDDELCCTKPSVGFHPFESTYEGYMGNWGNTVERWYHRAAVVMWPRRRTFLIRAKASACYALDALAKCLRDEGAAQARSNMAELRPFWASAWRDANDARLVGKVLQVARELGSGELATALLKPIGLERLTPRTVPLVVSLLNAHGAAWFEQVLQHWQLAVEYEATQVRLTWLASIDRVIAALAATGVKAAVQTGGQLVQQQWLWLQTRHVRARELAPRVVSKQLLSLEKPLLALLRSTIADYPKQREQMRRFLVADDFPLLVLAHLLQSARKEFDASEYDALGLGKVAGHCVLRLKRCLKERQRPVDDWSIAPPAKCACALCTEFARFLAARQSVSVEWPLAADRRAHIHGVIEQHELPVGHETRRSGRPYVLVLSKTRALFEREAAERVEWQRALDALQGEKCATLR